MKKTLLYSLLLAILVFGCNGKPSESTATTPSDSLVGDSVASTAVASEVPDIEGLTGYYVGQFDASKYHSGKNPSYSNRINLAIEHIGGGKVSGHSVVAGNSRPFAGTYVMEGANYKVDAAEPGDDKYDGKFAFVLDPAAHKVTGTWVANDGKISVYERKYELDLREFKYDPNAELPEDVEYQYLYTSQDQLDFDASGERLTNEVLKFNPSKVKLKKEDIENMFKGDLEIMRNSIYARHGYSFKNRKMRYVFDHTVEWYIPVSTDVSKELTTLEEENIALIKRYEEHAEAYYDSFGR